MWRGRRLFYYTLDYTRPKKLATSWWIHISVFMGRSRRIIFCVWGKRAKKEKRKFLMPFSSSLSLSLSIYLSIYLSIFPLSLSQTCIANYILYHMAWKRQTTRFVFLLLLSLSSLFSHTISPHTHKEPEQQQLRREKRQLVAASGTEGKKVLLSSCLAFVFSKQQHILWAATRTLFCLSVSLSIYCWCWHTHHTTYLTASLSQSRGLHLWFSYDGLSVHPVSFPLGSTITQQPQLSYTILDTSEGLFDLTSHMRFKCSFSHSRCFSVIFFVFCFVL